MAKYLTVLLAFFDSPWLSPRSVGALGSGDELVAFGVERELGSIDHLSGARGGGGGSGHR